MTLIVNRYWSVHGANAAREVERNKHPGVLSGTSSLSEAQIRQKLESGGYSQLQLHESATNQRDGTAMKNGRRIHIQVAPDGWVVEK